MKNLLNKKVPLNGWTMITMFLIITLEIIFFVSYFKFIR